MSGVARAGSRDAAQRGLSLVEALVAVVVLMLPGAAVLQGIVLSAESGGRAEARAAAIEVARGLADRIAATPIDEVYGTWGPDGSEGQTFAVQALDGRRATGRVRVVVDETATDVTLARAFGMPRDLDGDGHATRLNVATSARILPVLIEVEWGVAPHVERYRLPVVVVR